MPHPRAMRSNLLRAGQWTTLGYLLDFQMPLLPERSLRRHEGQRVEDLMRRWSGSTDWIDAEGEVYRSAFMRWPTAHTAIEYHRWAVRSFWRTDGLRFMSAMSEPITTDVLHIHGALDPMVLSASCRGSGGYVAGSYQFAALQTGHFPQEEAPDDLSALIIEWLNERTRS